MPSINEAEWAVRMLKVASHYPEQVPDARLIAMEINEERRSKTVDGNALSGFYARIAISDQSVLSKCFRMGRSDGCPAHYYAGADACRITQK